MKIDSFSLLYRKYAQNAENYKKNTGKDFPSFGAQDEGVQGSLAGQSAAPKAQENEEKINDTRQENTDAPDATEHDERKND